MEHVADLFSHIQKPTAAKQRRTERGDIFEDLLKRLNPPRVRDGYKPLTIRRVAYALTAVPTRDLYALLSKMDDAERRNGQLVREGKQPVPVGVVFWMEVKPRKI